MKRIITLLAVAASLTVMGQSPMGQYRPEFAPYSTTWSKDLSEFTQWSPDGTELTISIFPSCAYRELECYSLPTIFYSLIRPMTITDNGDTMVPSPGNHVDSFGTSVRLAKELKYTHGGLMKDSLYLVWMVFFNDSSGPIPPPRTKWYSELPLDSSDVFLTHYYGFPVRSMSGPVGITDISENKISVYPNPFTDKLTIEPDIPYRLFDLLGREADKQKLQTLPAGTYILKTEKGATRVEKM